MNTSDPNNLSGPHSSTFHDDQHQPDDEQLTSLPATTTMDQTRLIATMIAAAIEQQSVIKRPAVDPTPEMVTPSKKMRPKPSSEIRFSYDSNKEQYVFNETVYNLIMKAQAFTETEDSEYAMSLLKQCTDQIYKRQKILRIAEKYGWGTVREYTDDDLADGPEDNQKLRSSIWKARKNQSFRGRGAARSYQTSRFQPYDNASNQFGAFSISGNNGSNGSRQNNPSDPGQYGNRRTYPKRVPAPDDICGKCGEKGHWKASCTKVGN